MPWSPVQTTVDSLANNYSNSGVIDGGDTGQIHRPRHDSFEDRPVVVQDPHVSLLRPCLITVIVGKKSQVMRVVPVGRRNAFVVPDTDLGGFQQVKQVDIAVVIRLISSLLGPVQAVRLQGRP